MNPMGDQLFVWQDSYVSGVVAVDAQHKFIFDLARTVHRAIVDGEPWERVAADVDELYAAMHAHFRHEEGIMADRRYPQLAQHRGEHAGFLDQFAVARNRLEAGHDEVTPAVLRAVHDWITTHVGRADAQLCAFLRPT